MSKTVGKSTYIYTTNECSAPQWSIFNISTKTVIWKRKLKYEIWHILHFHLVLHCSGQSCSTYSKNTEHIGNPLCVSKNLGERLLLFSLKLSVHHYLPSYCHKNKEAIWVSVHSNKQLTFLPSSPKHSPNCLTVNVHLILWLYHHIFTWIKFMILKENTAMYHCHAQLHPRHWHTWHLSS